MQGECDRATDDGAAAHSRPFIIRFPHTSLPFDKYILQFGTLTVGKIHFAIDKYILQFGLNKTYWGLTDAIFRFAGRFLVIPAPGHTNHTGSLLPYQLNSGP